MSSPIPELNLHLANASNIITDSAKNACSGNCGSSSLSTLIGQGTNALIYLVGVISVIMIIAGGFLYVISSGDPGRQKRARDTILYAVIGVAIAIMSFAIVNFIIKRIH
jgi:cytochrome bd-type quinol oxidase subunit 2